MQEIELSIFDRGDGGALIQPMLDEFEQAHKVHVNLQVLDWEAGWSNLVEVALYGHGPDLSEVGSTWVMDFVRMNAVNSLSPLELASIGSEKDFITTNWNSAIVKASASHTPVVWAIPWTSDIRMAYYRRDLFDKANIDPAHAFEHSDSLSHAMETLKTKDATPPLTLGTLYSHINPHIMASWIWDAGGDFIAPDGKRVAFDSPEALRGMSSYFQLAKYIPANRREIVYAESDQLFTSGKAAITFSGYWIVRDLGLSTPIVQDNLGMRAMPSASFVGGTHLLTWKHSRKRDLTFTLIDFMVKHSAEYNLFLAYGLPAYAPSWEKAHFLPEPYFTTLFEALQKGRSFPISELWGLVEKRLTDAIPTIWEKVWDADEHDIEKILAEIILPLANRINMTLE